MENTLVLSSLELKALSPFLYLSAGLLISVLAAAYKVKSKTLKVLATIIFGPAIYLALSFVAQPAISIYPSVLVLSPLVYTLLAVFSLFAWLVYLFHEDSTKIDRHAEALSLLVLAALSYALVLGSRNFVALFVYLETAAICSYLLVSYFSNSRTGLEAGIKYILQGSFFSALYLMGVALLFGVVGSFEFIDIREYLLNVSPSAISPLLYAGFFFVLLSFFFKLTLVPTHFWAADVYQGSPTAFAAFLSGASKLSIFAFCSFILFSTGIYKLEIFQKFIFVAALFSVLLGNLMAFVQTSLKRLFIYSGVANVGYVAFALLALEKSFPSILIYIFIYSLAFIAVFSLIEIMSKVINDSTSFKDVKISQLAELRQSCPRSMLLLFALLVFSIAGLPPFPGFLAKFSILIDLWSTGNRAACFVVVLGALMGMAYYLKILIPLFLEDKASFATEKKDIKKFVQVKMLSPVLTFALLAVICVAFSEVFSFVSTFNLSLQ